MIGRDSEKIARVMALVNPLRTAKWSADFEWSRLEITLSQMGAEYGGYDLIPDFQRGHVWTEAQQTHYIENCMRGVIPASSNLIQFNCPQWSDFAAPSDLPDGFQCIDGLQRYTAIVRYVTGRIKAFGLYAEDFDGTPFSHKRFFVKVAIHDFTCRADLLKHYLSINAGGTPHSAAEIERVRGLLAECSA